MMVPTIDDLTSMDSRELVNMVQTYQLKYGRLSNEMEQLKSARNAPPSWTRAEPELPGENDYRFCGCFGSPKTSVLVYDHINNAFDAQSIESLRGMTLDILPNWPD
jgi:hypothetical protein